MAAAVPVVTAAEKALDAITGDIVVIRGQVFREREETFYGPDKTPKGRLRKHTKTFLVPVDLEVHVNPLSIGLGLGGILLAGAVAVVGGTIAWHGLDIPAPLGGAVELVPGVKDTELGKVLGSRVHAWLERHPGPVPEGFITEEATTATRQEQIPCDQARVLYSGFSDFTRGFCRRNGLSRADCLVEWQALKERCSL